MYRHRRHHSKIQNLLRKHKKKTQEEPLDATNEAALPRLVAGPVWSTI